MIDDINFFSQDNYSMLYEKLRDAQIQTYVLDGSEVHDAKSLWAHVAKDMPYPINLPYPKNLYVPTHWQAFADYIRFGLLLHEHEYSPRKVLIWKNAERMLEGGVQDLCIATTILMRLSFDVQLSCGTVYDPDASFSTFFLGYGPNFLNLITADTQLILR